MASCLVEDKLVKARFFQEMFLLTDISIEVVLEMPYLTFSNADIKFAEKKLTWKSYITAKALSTTKQVELIDKKEFTKVAFEENIEALVVYMTFLSLSLMLIYLVKEAQIASLLAKKVKILAKYSDFLDIFQKRRCQYY